MWGNSWKNVEAEYGAPMGIVLPMLANQCDTLEDVAKALNVDYSTFWGWAKRIGLRCVWVSNVTHPEDEPQTETAKK